MLLENRKHLPLVLRAQVKEAVPGKKSVKNIVQANRPHVCDLPLLRREMFLGNSDEFRRRIHAGDVAPILDEIAPDRFARATPDVEGARVGWQQGKKPIEPCFLE